MQSSWLLYILDGEAHEWWYHGLVTLGHNTITSYNDFTQRLMERFDKKGPEIHFKDLAQLKQTGSVEISISKFKRVAVMVSDMLESMLIMLFMEELSEPHCGWVKDYMPITFQDAISTTLDLQDYVPKNKPPQKPANLSKNKEKPTNILENRERIIPQREWLNKDTQRDLKRKNLCFNCKEPWVTDHRCMGKGKVHLIEVFLNNSEEDESEQKLNRELHST